MIILSHATRNIINIHIYNISVSFSAQMARTVFGTSFLAHPPLLKWLGSWDPGILRSWDPGILGSWDPRIPGSQDLRIPGSQDPILCLLRRPSRTPESPGNHPSFQTGVWPINISHAKTVVCCNWCWCAPLDTG